MDYLNVETIEEIQTNASTNHLSREIISINMFMAIPTIEIDTSEAEKVKLFADIAETDNILKKYEEQFKFYRCLIIE